MKSFYTKKKALSLLAVAAAVLLGSAASSAQAPLYHTDFSTSLSSLGFSTIDANSDGNTWTASSSTIAFQIYDGVNLGSDLKDKKYVYLVSIGTTDNDDWLVTPDIALETGKTYKTTFLMGKVNNGGQDECFEIKMSKTRTASALNAGTVLVKLEDGNFPTGGGGSLKTYTVEISVPEDGDYYIGIHAVGKPANKFGIAEFTIANGVAMVTPSAVTDLTLVPDPSGAKKVTLNFNAPSFAKNGTALTALTKINILRDGEVVGTIDNPAPGSAQSYEDKPVVSGIYTYSVQAFSADGGGDIVSAKTFVGTNTPSAVQSVAAVNTADRSAKISWEAPTLDKDGYPIPASILFYSVYRNERFSSVKTLVAEDIAELSYEDTLPDDLNPDTQLFYEYSVVAKSNAGEAAAVGSLPVPMGTPFDVPFLESFAGGKVNTLGATARVSGSASNSNAWAYLTYDEDVQPADNDRGMAYLNCSLNNVAAFFTGLIDLGEMASPTLTYYVYNIPTGDETDNTLEVVVTATDGTSKTFAAYSPALGWTKAVLPLTEFTGKTVRLTFNGARNNPSIMYLDAICIDNILSHDLSAHALTIPEKVRSSEPFDVVVDVLNSGSDVSGNYTVELYCDGTLVDSDDASALAVGAHYFATFSRTHAVTDPETVTYSATVVYDADMNVDNNSTAPVTVTVRKNSYPTVADLKGSLTGNTVTLAWSEPDTENAQPYETLETFDTYIPWANDGTIGDWTLVDLDKAEIAGFQDFDMPGIPDFSQQSWWVFNNTLEDVDMGSFATLSGHQFLASMISGSRTTGSAVQNDDWAISPLLFGGAQTITVNARSYNALELESFEVLYSTGSLEPADFISVGKVEEVPNEYTAYDFDLPDGARHFAIRNISLNKHTLMVDDVTYIPTGDPAAFSINGYNVYRDGVKINAEPVEENEFEDLTAPEGDHVYNVTVLYSAGESRFSNDWSTAAAGIENVAVDSLECQYFNLQGIRVLSPASGNIYIVRKGREVRKVLIP